MSMCPALVYDVGHSVGVFFLSVVVSLQLVFGSKYRCGDLVILIPSIVAYHDGLSSFIKPLRVACINLSCGYSLLRFP